MSSVGNKLARVEKDGYEYSVYRFMEKPYNGIWQYEIRVCKVGSSYAFTSYKCAKTTWKKKLNEVLR